MKLFSCPICHKPIKKKKYNAHLLGYHAYHADAKELRKKQELAVARRKEKAVREQREKRKRRRKKPHQKTKLKYGPEWTEALRKQIRERDGHVCQWCGMPQEDNFQKLSVHHIDFNPMNCDPKNLVSLCLDCHDIEAHGGKYRKKKASINRWCDYK